MQSAVLTLGNTVKDSGSFWMGGRLCYEGGSSKGVIWQLSVSGTRQTGGGEAKHKPVVKANMETSWPNVQSGGEMWSLWNPVSSKIILELKPKPNVREII